MNLIPRSLRCSISVMASSNIPCKISLHRSSLDNSTLTFSSSKYFSVLYLASTSYKLWTDTSLYSIPAIIMLLFSFSRTRCYSTSSSLAFLFSRTRSFSCLTPVNLSVITRSRLDSYNRCDIYRSVRNV
jgi:hypothetical protein